MCLSFRSAMSTKNHRSVTVMDDVMEEAILEEGDDGEEVLFYFCFFLIIEINVYFVGLRPFKKPFYS